jgi:hypothetical protein
MGTKKDIGERRLRNKENGISERGDQRWIDREFSECHFKDVRLQKRFGMLLEQMSGGIGESIPFVCQDWANTKAAYRFLSNKRVSEEEILRGHFQSTRERLALESDRILILHDTTEFSYQKENAESTGLLHHPPAGKYKDGRPRLRVLDAHAAGETKPAAITKIWTGLGFRPPVGSGRLARDHRRNGQPKAL